MSKKQSSLHMSNEFNGYGNSRYLKATQYSIYPPLPQENVQIAPDYKDYLLKVIGSTPMVIEPSNTNPALSAMLGSMTSLNQVIITKDTATENYAILFNMSQSSALTNGSYPHFVQVMGSEVPTTMGVPGQWVLDNVKWKYYENGNPLKNSWVKYKEKWYYLDADEYMVTDWKKIAGKWYYFKPGQENGYMVLKWRDIDGKWYYFKEEGEAGYMVRDWREINGKWYYFNKEGEDGYMVLGWKDIK